MKSQRIWKCTICGNEFPSRHKMQLHRKEAHKFVKGTAWNKGLTKETSEIIRAWAEKVGASLKGKSHSVSKEAREKLSLIRSKFLEKENSGGFKDVKWYKVNNLSGQEYVVRGTWELTVANLLNSHGVNWIKNKQLPYVKDGIQKTYNPDFYLPDTNEYIEVKGYYSDNDKIKMQLVLDQHEGIRIYMIDSKAYPLVKENKIWLNEDLILRNNQVVS